MKVSTRNVRGRARGDEGKREGSELEEGVRERKRKMKGEGEGEGLRGV